MLIDERNLHDSLPILLLSVQILLELRWVEVQNRRVRIEHKILQHIVRNHFIHPYLGLRTLYGTGMSSLLASGSTPISCSNGRNGWPRLNWKDISSTPLRSIHGVRH